MMRWSLVTTLLGQARPVALAFTTVGSTALSAQAHDNSRVVFAGSFDWLGQLPIAIAIEKGFFRERGIVFDFENIVASSDRMRALTAGSADLANIGSTALIVDMAHGNRSFFVSGNIDDAPGNEGCWGRRGINTISDLRGKLVAATASAEITLLQLLAEQNIESSSVSIVDLPANEMARAIAHQDVDAACVWQPLLDQVARAVPNGKLLGTDRQTMNFRLFGMMTSPDALVVSRGLVEQRPALARSVIDAILDAADYVNAYPEEAGRIGAPYFHRTPAQILDGERKFTFYGHYKQQERLRLQLKQMQFLADWLHDHAKIATLPEVAAWQMAAVSQEAAK